MPDIQLLIVSTFEVYTNIVVYFIQICSRTIKMYKMVVEI